MTTGQNRRLYQLLNQTGQIKYKAELVSSYSAKKSTSSRDLTPNEARELIAHLERQANKLELQQQPKPSEKMRRKIFSLCWDMGFCQEANTKEENSKIVKGLVERLGVLKPKALNQYTEQELPKLVTQFEQMKRNNDKQYARVLVRELLEGV
jgi:hypothetical protein